MYTDEMPVWDGLSDLVKAGFDDKQIRRIIFFRQYHREHPERSCQTARRFPCQAADALDQAIREGQLG